MHRILPMSMLVTSLRPLFCPQISSCGFFPSEATMSPRSDTTPPKKRESRAGTRKVTSLSAEQLERKRANDREAQRTIRQRTKEHIEDLEHQVRELRIKGEQFDDMVRRNALLETENRTLRHQLAMTNSGPGYQNMAEGSYAGPSGSMIPSSQFPEALGVNPVSRAPSVLSTPGRVSTAPDWQCCSSTRSPSACGSSEPDYSHRVEPYAFEGALQPPSAMSVAAPPHVGFNVSGSSQPPAPAFQGYPPIYQPGSASHGHSEDPSMSYMHAQQPIPVQSAPPDRDGGGYPVLPTAQPYQHPLQPHQHHPHHNLHQHPHHHHHNHHPPRSDYSYDWTHHP
ncbi:bZIP transcription factor [Aspergillus candidus]|uniref:BZIP domain-containing protein n=1 Tax=Aspergillus candidus TaxID=41067 RepID=A0A2I2F9Z1_ASPCN|nr:hypothetical protein BDW47DRAFT_38289 [Aspergillus candidus]PLB37452.1 hypothetical protein BDW47DRAFT_38289 [Aspergillus candidus]